MSHTPPLIDPMETIPVIDSTLLSSPPPEEHESMVSSPQGTAPKPLAGFSPIATPIVKTNSAIQSETSPSIECSLVAVEGVPVASQSVSKVILQREEDLKTPEKTAKQEMEISKPEKKMVSVFKSNDKTPRRSLFSTKPKAKQSKTKRAGLVMSVARVLGKLKAGRYSRRVGVTGAVYLASVLEYLVAEVLELAGNCARFFRKKRVSPRCIQLSLLHDKELDQLTRGVVVPQGGVRPYIHPVLLGKTVPGGGVGGPGQGAAQPEDQMMRRSYLEEEEG